MRIISFQRLLMVGAVGVFLFWGIAGVSASMHPDGSEVMLEQQRLMMRQRERMERDLLMRKKKHRNHHLRKGDPRYHRDEKSHYRKDDKD